LEIGTPNIIELLGDLNALGAVAEYFGLFLTAGYFGAKAYGEFKINQAKAEVLRAKAAILFAKGKISQSAFELKTRDLDPDQLSAIRAIIAPQAPPKPKPAPARRRTKFTSLNLES
jgi:hypothetical protein